MKYKGTLITVKDMAAAREFYCRVLGLKVTADFGANVTLDDAVFLQTTETWKDFIHREVGSPAHDGELYFEVDDFPAFMKRLEGFSDIEYIHPAEEADWGQCSVRFCDLDGHIIEVGENLLFVVKRFAAAGMSTEEIARRMDVSADYIKQCLNR